MPTRQGRSLIVFVAILAIPPMAAGCASPRDGVGTNAEAVGDPPQAEQRADGGIEVLPARPIVDGREPGELGHALQCVRGFDPFICDGGCAGPGEGCCVTGVRPLGVCRNLDDCTEQCAYDCGVHASRRGREAGLHCASLCTWLSPEAECLPTR